MNYKEFMNYVQKNTEKFAGKGGKTTISHIIKNNGIELDGLIIMEKDVNTSPTIYLNQFYEEYENGRDLNDIIEEIKIK